MLVRVILAIILLTPHIYSPAVARGKSELPRLFITGVIYEAIKKSTNNNPNIERLEKDAVTIDRASIELENIVLPDISNVVPTIEIKDGYRLAKGFSEKTGKLVMEGIIKNDKFNGPAKEYYPNGEIAREIIYKDNEIEGTVKIYYSNGKLASIFEIKNGILGGKREFFYKSGELLSKINYANNKATGKYRLYLPSGKFYQLDGKDAGKDVEKNGFVMEEYNASEKLVYYHKFSAGKVESIKANIPLKYTVSETVG